MYNISLRIISQEVILIIFCIILIYIKCFDLENWDTFPSPEDWDNEEYTGSLADTKVFTPSGGAESAVTNDVDASKPNENAYLEVEDWNDAVQSPTQQAAAIVNNVIFKSFRCDSVIYYYFFMLERNCRKTGFNC